MPNYHGVLPQRRHWRWYANALCRLVFVAVLTCVSFTLRVHAHEGHDHDQPSPLNVPIAPRLVAVTPDYELVAVLSGEQRLTIFLHRFATGEPIKGGKLFASLDDQEIEAQAKEPGVFELTAPWIKSAQSVDITFKLVLPDDQDILTGHLEKLATSAISESVTPSDFVGRHGALLTALAALLAGILLTLLVRRGSSRTRVPISVVLAGVLVAGLPAADGHAQVELPSVPATMATDVPQRLPDGTLFVPKATQHLLSMRTTLTVDSKAPRTVQLVGTIIADPGGFGRVQSGQAGRIEAPSQGLPFIGKRVAAGEVLAYLHHYIEAFNKGTLQADVAELEERIKLQEARLARLLQAPLAIPPIKIDEAKGELAALRQKRKELAPMLVTREEILAPVSGVVSVANVVAGQAVDARDVLFEIVDPTRFWVEAITHDASVVARLSGAVAVTNEGEKLELEFAGAGLSLKQQAAPLTFRVKGSSPGLAIGKPVTVILQSTVDVLGIVLPTSSIVRAPSGLPMVWVKTDAERFEPHTVRYEPLDGQRVVVLSGLKVDARVVVEGATLLSQVR